MLSHDQLRSHAPLLLLRILVVGALALTGLAGTARAAQPLVNDEIATAAVMTGTITAAGSPVAAQVRIFDDTDALASTVMSNSVTGQFTAVLADGQYRVRVSKSGHVTQYYANHTSLASADPITVIADAPPEAAQFSVDVDLTPEVVVDPFDGLQNPSFESALDPATNWSARRTVATDEGESYEPASCLPGDRAGVCVVGADSFPDEDSDTAHTVAPLDGSNMLRLGGPFTNNAQLQPVERYSVKQRFVVDSDNPVVTLNYNAYMYDYTGFDNFQMRVTLKDEEGDVVFERNQGAFASGTALKTTGWMGSEVDLSEFVGQVVSLKVEAGGTKDDLYGWWVYVDAGTVPDPAVGNPTVAHQVTAPDDTIIPITVNPGPNGQTFITVPASAPGLFEDGCLPIPLTSIGINTGQGIVSDARLVLNDQKLPLVDSDGDGNFSVEGPLCAESGTLFVQYTLTEGDQSHHFSIPIGGVTLIDPQGVVFDVDRFATRLAELGSSADCVETDAQCAADKTAARSFAAIPGATVTLERLVDGNFVKVLSGDPGISPNVNPQVTSDTGLYQWDVAEGTYRVRVAKGGYVSVTTPSVVIPPPVLDLHVGLERKKPTGTVGFTPSAPFAGDTVMFTVAPQHPDGSAAIKEVNWDLDNDGTFDDGTGPTAAMKPAVGTHPIRVELVDDDGDRVVVATSVMAGVRPQPTVPTPTPTPTTSNPAAPSPEPSPTVTQSAGPKPTLRAMPKKIKRGKRKALPGTAATGQSMTYRSKTPKVCRVSGTGAKSRVTGRKAGTCVLRATIRPGKGLVTAKTLSVRIRVK